MNMEAFWRLGAGGGWHPWTTGDLNNLWVHEIMQVFFILLEQLSGAHDRVDLFTEIEGSQLGPEGDWIYGYAPLLWIQIISSVEGGD